MKAAMKKAHRHNMPHATAAAEAAQACVNTSSHRTNAKANRVGHGRAFLRDCYTGGSSAAI